MAAGKGRQQQVPNLLPVTKNKTMSTVHLKKKRSLVIDPVRRGRSPARGPEPDRGPENRPLTRIPEVGQGGHHLLKGTMLYPAILLKGHRVPPAGLRRGRGQKGKHRYEEALHLQKHPSKVSVQPNLPQCRN